MRLLKALVTLFLALAISSTGSANPNIGFIYSGPSGDAGAPWLVSWQAPILEVEGLRFKDLNKNGVLDPYEDWRLSPAQRAEDLIAKMDGPEKAAQLLHITLYSPREAWFTEQNVGFALAYDYLSAGPAEAAVRVNQLQQWSESSKYGIPLIISMDSVNGASWVRGATLYPDQIGLAATRDPELVSRLNSMQRVEMTAMGIRMSLSPIADLATEPRWGRLQECFGEDAELAKVMVAAAVLALQAGSELNNDSVLVSVKHFPGSGPQAGGVDGSPIIFAEDSIDIHLSVFEGAIAAVAGSIMPYGYSEVPFLEGDAAQRPAHESRVVMTELLRERLAYDGLIQTDWGMRHLDAALAGADIVGGAGVREIPRLAEGLAPEELDAKVRRVLEVKFQLGLFENPYADPEYAASVVGCEAHRELAYEAAAKSLTLLKHEIDRCLSDCTCRIFLLDEPLGNLDAKLREQVRFELKRIQRRLGVTTIYVTHDQTEAMTLADKIVLMQDGKAIQEGTPSELYRRPQNTFVAGFVGTPRINFLECTLSMDGGLPVFINEGIKFGADQALSARLQDGKRYILGIRPSDFTLTDPGDLNGIRGRVELMELLGDDLLVHFTVGEQILTAKLDAGVHDQIGDEVVVRIDPSNLHLFDGELQTRVG